MKLLLRIPALLAVAALVLAPPATAQETVEAIMEAIREQRDDVDAGLFTRLAEIGDEASLEALKKVPAMLGDERKRDAAYLAFSIYAGLDELQADAIAFLVGEAGSNQASRREGATKGLGAFEELAQDELERLAKRSKYGAVKGYACRALLPLLKSQGADTKLDLLVESARVPQTGTVAELAAAFDEWDQPKNTRVFCEALESRKTDSRTKRALILVVTDRDFEDIDEALTDALKDDSPLTQYRAMEALGERGSREHEKMLGRMANSDADAVRRLAFLQAAQLDPDGEGSVKKLSKAARSKDPATRQGAAAALAINGAPEARAVLEELLADEDRLVRIEAVRQLVSMRDKASVPALIARLDVESGRVRDDVADGLRLLTGLDHGTAGTRWSRWWENEGAGFTLPSREEAVAAADARRENKERSATVASFYGLDVQSDRIAFVLDTSGSMNETQGRGTRMEAAREQLRASLEGYPDGAWFNLVFFSSGVTPWREEMVRMDDFTRNAALDYVNRQGPGGATAIYDALRMVFADRNVDTIFLLTDGEPQGGTENDPLAIREAVELWNLARGIEIHCVSVGTSSDLLRDLARDSGGKYREER